MMSTVFLAADFTVNFSFSKILRSVLILLLSSINVVNSQRLQNISSVSFKELAKSTYDKIFPCFKSAEWMFKKSINISDFVFPDDAEKHFADIKKRMSSYLSTNFTSTMEYAGYKGPWAENVFLQMYYDKPLHFYNGLIPIFVQWLDFQLRKDFNYVAYIIAELKAVIRTNVLYFAVTCGDGGLGKIGLQFPNILEFSSGGFGHIPLPQIKGELKYQEPPTTTSNYKHDISFYGRYDTPYRKPIISDIKQFSTNVGLNFSYGSGPSWQHEMQLTKFNLAPRGAGRNSYRFVESIQLGRIPIFIYDDIPWIPYLGTEIGVNNFGLIGVHNPTHSNLSEIVHKIANMSDIEFSHKMLIVKNVREWYTNEGVFKQFELFLNDPFGLNGGYLRCSSVHAKTERCCDFI